jgi:transcription elongation factor SPT6
MDQKYCQLKTRKENLLKLYQRMKNFQLEQISLLTKKQQELEEKKIVYAQDNNLDYQDKEYEMKKIDEEEQSILRIIDTIRILEESELKKIENIQTIEEFHDYYHHFHLHYGSDLISMKEFEVKSKTKLKNKNDKNKKDIDENENSDEEFRTDNTDDIKDYESENESENFKFNKFASKKDRYHYCKLIGLNNLAKKFGLTPEQYGENLLADYQKNEIEQWNIEPSILCMDYVREPYFQSVDQVLNTVKYMISLQLARDPTVRSYVRDLFTHHACITVKPTFPRGLKEIDENHICYKYKYLKMKPCKSLKEDEFLKLTNAENDGLLTIKFELESLKNYTYIESNYQKKDNNDSNKLDSVDKNIADDDWDDDPKTETIKNNLNNDINQDSISHNKTIIEKLKSFYHKDEFSYNVEQWNIQRARIIEDMCNLYLYPEFEKELRHKILNESKNFVYRECAKRLKETIKVAPYTTESLTLDDESNNGLKVISITYSTFEDAPNGSSASAICACVNGDGELDEYIKLNKLTTKLNRGFNTEQSEFFNTDKKEKMQELKNIENFIINKMPNVIIVASENKDAPMIVEDLKNLLKKLEENKEKVGQINIELVDNEMAKIFSSTKIAEQEFGIQIPALVIQAVALARFLQDPLLCYSQLFNTGLFVKFLKK